MAFIWPSFKAWRVKGKIWHDIWIYHTQLPICSPFNVMAYLQHLEHYFTSCVIVTFSYLWWPWFDLLQHQSDCYHSEILSRDNNPANNCMIVLATLSGTKKRIVDGVTGLYGIIPSTRNVWTEITNCLIFMAHHCSRHVIIRCTTR